MTTLREAAQQALVACKLIVSAFDALKPANAARNEPLQINAARASITALEAALAEPGQEPAAKCIDDICSEHLGRVEAFDHLPRGTLLYAAPPQRPAQPQEPLTDTYVQDVPDKCDRIVWRGQYFHLPVNSTSEPVQEPAGQLQEEAFGRGQVMWFNKPADLSMLYTAPPQRRPLTDEQKQTIHNETGAGHSLICLVESYINDIK